MDFNLIKYEVDGHVATIVLDRPDKLNAASPEMVTELVQAFDRADEADAVRAIILTGNGRAFCAGADLGAGGSTFDYDDGPSDGPALPDGGGLVTLRIFRSKKPVIAAVNGPAVGMGATMTLPCDFRVMAQDARYGFVFAARGIVPDGACSWFLPRIVGITQALDWCLTARVFPASEALDAGLVRSVHPVGELLDAARSIAEEISAAAAPVSAAITRQMMWRMLGASHPMEAHRVDSLAIVQTGKLADAREGISAFMEKRPANWTLSPSRDMPDWHPWWDEPSYD